MKQIKGDWRRWGWIVCLALIIGLGAGAWKPMLASIRQAQGVRALLQAGAGMSTEELAIPFVCMRQPGEAGLAKTSLQYLDDPYLQGVGLCLAGETQAGLAQLEQAGAHANGAAQAAGGNDTSDATVRVQALLDLGLADDELVPILLRLSALPEVEPYPALRVLAEKANGEIKTWNMWLQGSTRLEQAGEWQAAAEWVSEGVKLAPPEVRGSLYQRLGRIFQTRKDAPDYQAALTYYEQALEAGGWISASHEAYTHLYRGEIYRGHKDEFSPEQALEEFQTALELQPGDYWALMDIGHVYLFSIKDFEQAERWYRQALASNDKNPQAYYYLGEVCRERGETQEAMAWYQQALEKLPGWQAALDRLAELEGK